MSETMENTSATTEVAKPDPASQININLPNPIVQNETFKFHFKKDELGNKRPTFEAVLPVPTAHGLAAVFNEGNEKQLEFVLSLMRDAIYLAARQQVGDENKPVNKQDEFDITKLTLSYLANLPAAERRGGGIAKEIWEAFGKDYLEVMPGLTGKKAENIANAVSIFLKKFQPVKTNKKVLAFLSEQLDLWFTSTTNAEEFQECYEFLKNKADTLIKTDEAELLANL